MIFGPLESSVAPNSLSRDALGVYNLVSKAGGNEKVVWLGLRQL